MVVIGWPVRSRCRTALAEMVSGEMSKRYGASLILWTGHWLHPRYGRYRHCWQLAPAFHLVHLPLLDIVSVAFKPNQFLLTGRIPQTGSAVTARC